MNTCNLWDHRVQVREFHHHQNQHLYGNKIINKNLLFFLRINWNILNRPWSWLKNNNTFITSSFRWTNFKFISSGFLRCNTNMWWTLNKWKITCNIICCFLRFLIGYINRMSSSTSKIKLNKIWLSNIKLTLNQLYFPIVNDQSNRKIFISIIYEFNRLTGGPRSAFPRRL